MSENNFLGTWIRRFLLEHLPVERNLARNTQKSYRDTLQQLLPFVARRGRKRIDRLVRRTANRSGEERTPACGLLPGKGGDGRPSRSAGCHCNDCK